MMARALELGVTKRAFELDAELGATKIKANINMIMW